MDKEEQARAEASCDQPTPGTLAIVRCRDYSCLAYVDGGGTWRSYYKHEALPRVLDWEPIGTSGRKGDRR